MDNTSCKIQLNRLMATINESAEIGKIPGNGLGRLALTDDDKHMRDVLKKWMVEAGLEVRVDDFGVMYGRRKGKADKKPVLMGSHLDTQPNGGRFDGVLGVLAALEVVRTLNDFNIETERPIEIVNFTNEEGARFEPSMLASGALAGDYERDEVYQIKDHHGKRFGDELERIGYKGQAENRIQDPSAYIELHIEQGPILENEGVSVGAVEGIQGEYALEVVIRGESGHAGTTPMNMRKDALAAAVEMIGDVESLAKTQGTVATVGRLSLSPDVVNVIPGEVTFSVDIRHFNDQMMEELIQEVKHNIQVIAKRRGVTAAVRDLWPTPTVHFDPEIVRLIETISEEQGYTVKRMLSGAGHDAKYMNRLAPTAMIFVPSVEGKSHVESEFTKDEDIEKGANVLLHLIHWLANR